MLTISDEKAVHYRLDRWGRAFRIFYREPGAQNSCGVSYGNSLLADWVKFGGPPPRGRDCSGNDLAENPIEQQTEQAVMVIAKSRPDAAWALRARWCGSGRVGVERLELFNQLTGCDWRRARFYEAIKLGESMLANLILRREFERQSHAA